MVENMGKTLEKLSFKEFSKLMYFINSFSYIFQVSLFFCAVLFPWNSFKGCFYVMKIIPIIERHNVKIDRHNNAKKTCVIKLVKYNLVLNYLRCQEMKLS